MGPGAENAFSFSPRPGTGTERRRDRGRDSGGGGPEEDVMALGGDGVDGHLHFIHSPPHALAHGKLGPVPHAVGHSPSPSAPGAGGSRAAVGARSALDDEEKGWASGVRFFPGRRRPAASPADNASVRSPSPAAACCSPSQRPKGERGPRNKKGGEWEEGKERDGREEELKETW
jgi:hypothetical protein